MSDDWVIVSDGARVYKKQCSICQQEIVLTQIGEEIEEKLLAEILDHVHVRNNFDSYQTFKFIKKKDRWIKICLDIENKTCHI